jgi:hypothetical protein
MHEGFEKGEIPFPEFGKDRNTAEEAGDRLLIGLSPEDIVP